MIQLIISTFAWLCVWFVGMGWFWWARERLGISYSSWWIVAPTYIMFSLLLVRLLPATALHIANLDFHSIAFYGLLYVLLVGAVVYSFVDHRRELRGGSKSGVIPGIEHLISKTAELIFQQVCILGLVDICLQISVSPAKSLDSFTVIFWLIHLPLIGILPRFWSTYFIVFALVGGFLFGALTVLIPNGWFLAMACHHLFYIATSWWAHNNREHLVRGKHHIPARKAAFSTEV